MKRVVVVAGDRVGSLMAGPGIRALEIARALHGHGLPVLLAAPGGVDLELPFATLGYDATGDSLRPEMNVCGAAVLGGMVLARQPWLAECDLPLVVDVYGPYVLENLPAAAAGGDSADRRRRRHAGDVEAMAMELERGDFFLCASEKQRDFWIGALTALGRVNPDTYSVDPELRGIIDVVPFGVPPDQASAGARSIRENVPGIGKDDRVVLWMGGLWDWLDPITLIRAVADVAKHRDDVRLFFMGAKSPSADVPPMRALDDSVGLARELGLIDRVVFFHEGWVPYADRANYLLDADIGASLHLPHIETRFAFRTRLLDCIWSGLPALVSQGDVLAEEMTERGVARAVPPGSVEKTAEALAAMLDEPRVDPARRGAFDALRAAYAWPRVVAPLEEFVREPRRAADQPSEAIAGGRLAPTPVGKLPALALGALREGGPLLLAEEVSRYLRWRQRRK